MTTKSVTRTEAALPVDSDRDDYVWPVIVRCCHWVVVLSFLFLSLTGTAILAEKYMAIGGQNKIMMKTVHVYAGYVLGAALTLRIIWGFVGNSASRWTRILPLNRQYFTELRLYLASIRAGRPRAYRGHNPLGRLMVTALILLLVAQVATGLVVGGADVYAWPFGDMFRHWIAQAGIDPYSLVPGSQQGVDPQLYAEMRAFRAPLRLTHEYMFYVLAGLVVIHIAGVIWTETCHRVPVVSSMISGRKQLRDEAVDDEPLPQTRRATAAVSEHQ